jgi:hypothetical protein
MLKGRGLPAALKRVSTIQSAFHILPLHSEMGFLLCVYGVTAARLSHLSVSWEACLVSYSASWIKICLSPLSKSMRSPVLLAPEAVTVTGFH